MKHRIQFVFTIMAQKQSYKLPTCLSMQFSSTIYIEHEGLEILALKYHQLNVYFVTSRQDWLGIAKPKITSDQP